MKIVIFGSGSKTAQALRHYLNTEQFEATWISSNPLTHDIPPHHAAEILDILDFDAVIAKLRMIQPEVVVNLAAMTNVDGCEFDPELADSLNHRFPALLAETSRELGFYLCHISTDYVFDGNHGPYEITDIPTGENLSVYGRTKWLAEEPVLLSQGSVIRTNVLYSKDAQSQDFLSYLESKFNAENPGVITIVNDQFNNPASTDDLSRAIMRAVELRHHGILHCGGKLWLSRYELAQLAKLYWGYPKADITAIDTKVLQQPAVRPIYGGLKIEETERILGLEFSSVLDYLLETSPKNLNMPQDSKDAWEQLSIEDRLLVTLDVEKPPTIPNRGVLEQSAKVIAMIPNFMHRDLDLRYQSNHHGTISISGYNEKAMFISECGQSNFSCLLYSKHYDEQQQRFSSDLLIGEVFSYEDLDVTFKKIEDLILSLGVEHHPGS